MECEEPTAALIGQIYGSCEGALADITVDYEHCHELITQFRTEAGRFRLWGDGFDMDSGSFDLMLSNWEDMQATIIILLTGVARSLKQLLPSKSPRAKELGIYLERAEYIVPEAAQNAEDNDTYETGEAIEDLCALNNCLYELIPLIEDFQLPADGREAPGNESVLSSTSAEDEWRPYYTKINDRFPKADRKLTNSLAQLNWLRYQKIREARELSISESHPTVQPVIADEKTVVTELTESSMPRVLRELKDNFSDVSVSSLASTTAEDFGNARLPPPPVDLGPDVTFQCNLCFENQSRIYTKNQWRKHVFRDLEPYSCSFPECNFGSKPRTFSSRNEWIDHEFSEHRGVFEWTCIESCGLITDRRDDFENHLREKHLDGTQEEKGHIKFIIERFRRKISSPKTTRCPLCADQVKESAVLLQRHLGRHFEEIALAVVPLENYCYDDGHDILDTSEDEVKEGGAEEVEGEEEEAQAVEEAEEDIKNCCLCGGVSMETMVTCENNDCPKVRFHIGCVGLAEKDATADIKWFCPYCENSPAARRAGKREKEITTEVPDKHGYHLVASLRDFKTFLNGLPADSIIVLAFLRQKPPTHPADQAGINCFNNLELRERENRRVRFALYWVGVSHDESLESQFAVSVTPTFLFLDRSMKIQRRVDGADQASCHNAIDSLCQDDLQVPHHSSTDTPLAPSQRTQASTGAVYNHRYAQPSHYPMPSAIDRPFRIPADGIDHQVIQTEISPYLGGEAGVKRGYDPQTGRDVYDYCAYRPLTSSIYDSSAAFREAIREARRWGGPPPEYIRYAMSRGRRPEPHPNSAAEEFLRPTTSTRTSPPVQDSMLVSTSATQPPPPLDPVTRLPIQGYWGRDPNGDEVFYRYKQKAQAFASYSRTPQADPAASVIPKDTASTRTTTHPPVQDNISAFEGDMQLPPPLDLVTGLPVQGYWGVDANGCQVFYQYRPGPKKED